MNTTKNSLPRQFQPQRRIGDLGRDAGERRESLETRMAAVETKLDKNTEMTARVVELIEALEAGIKVLGALGRLAKWLAPIITVCVAVYAIVTGNRVGK